ncbi:MAG: hypothetical protein K9L68_03885 [Spirochaetales bacterium]|nr:hypothetical protein [Spirochaetales bacterium]MCF7937719.1 hypothetical protein [Spirochaetales bacterium]
MNIATPITNSYWVEPESFLAGEYPGDSLLEQAHSKLGALTRAGVRAFIDLTTPQDGLETYAHLLNVPPDGPIAYQRFPITDQSVPDSPEKMKDILDAVDEHLGSGRMLYLHCWGGVGRTGLVVGCWLARHGLRGQAALDRLEKLWKNCPKSSYISSPESSEQRQYVRDWKEKEFPLQKSRPNQLDSD